jgi:hypothetical protein
LAPPSPSSGLLSPFLSLSDASSRSINFLIALVIPDIPSTTEIQIKRQEYIVGKVLNNIKVPTLPSLLLSRLTGAGRRG